MTHPLFLVLVLLLGGCTPAAWQVVTQQLGEAVRSGAASQWLGSILSVAEDGAAAYFARHPDQARQAEVAAALRLARRAQEALDAALAAGSAVDTADAEKARSEALRTYSALRALLDEMGVLSGSPPVGGAMGEAPDPGPLELPTVAAVDARL